MRAKLKVCTEPGCGEIQPGPRCREHQRAVERSQQRTSPSKATRHLDRARRRAAVVAHRARHGDWCPGFGVPAHASADLTADHRRELQDGGRWDGPLDVLCRSCNSRKAKQTQDRLRKPNECSNESGAPLGGTPDGPSAPPPPGRALDGAEGSRGRGD